ncbi:MAG: hypothetical protein IPL97_14710 [Niastella sp.]|nr:hypothetical protein [Niastella sp.]
MLQESVMNGIDFGGAPMSPAIARKALQLMSRATMPNETISNHLPEMITNREEEILKIYG